VALPNSFDFNDGAGTVLLLMPDAVNDRPVHLDLHGETVVTPISGVRYVSKDGSKPSGLWTFEFFERDRATLQFLKDFYDTQRAMAGKYNSSDGTSQGFWFPTWQWEQEIVDSNGANFVDFVRRGYADTVFALGAQFRRFVVAKQGNYSSFKATSASVVAGVDHVLFSLNTTSGTQPPTPWTRAGGGRPLWLRYGRFDSDDFAYSHEDGGDAFRVTVMIRELPDEAT
jgi:hypothetical protein